MRRYTDTWGQKSSVRGAVSITPIVVGLFFVVTGIRKLVSPFIESFSKIILLSLSLQISLHYPHLVELEYNHELYQISGIGLDSGSIGSWRVFDK